VSLFDDIISPVIEEEDMTTYPSVDNGKIYREITKFIENQNFVFDIDELLTVKQVENLAEDVKFFKIADCALNIKKNFPKSKRKFIDSKNYDGKLVDYIPVKEHERLWNADQKEWLYLIAYSKKVVKIGMTSSGLQSRFSSYNCGTKKAMIKGSCATTNFVITQANYLAIQKKFDVEILAYEVPENWTEMRIFGKKQKVLNKVAHKYESTLIDFYYKKTQKMPPLCSASGPSDEK
jgi:hypothetical protein